MYIQSKWTHFERDAAPNFVHLSQEGRDEGGFPGAHLTHHSHQLTTPNPQVDTEEKM